MFFIGRSFSLRMEISRDIVVTILTPCIQLSENNLLTVNQKGFTIQLTDTEDAPERFGRMRDATSRCRTWRGLGLPYCFCCKLPSPAPDLLDKIVTSPNPLLIDNRWQLARLIISLLN